MLAVVAASFTAVFCFLGTELVGIAAGEGENPEETIPRQLKPYLLELLYFILVQHLLLQP